MDDVLNKLFLAPINTPEDLKNWVYVFLGIDLPIGRVDPASNSSPVEWLFDAYTTLARNEGNKVPGYVVYSCREGYKCQAAGSLILTQSELKRIEDIKVGDIVWTGFSWKPVTNWIDNGISNGLKVVTESNITLTSTPIHPYWVIRNGVPQWIRACDLNPTTDYLCINIDSGWSQSYCYYGKQFNYGYLVGLMLSHGERVSDVERHKLLLPSTTNSFVLRFSKSIRSRVRKANDLLRKEYNIFFIERDDALYLLVPPSLQELCQWAQITSSLSIRVIPEVCYKDINFALGFINALMDLNGVFNMDSSITLRFRSNDLATQLQILLLAIGVYSTRSVLSGKVTIVNSSKSILTIYYNSLLNLFEKGIKLLPELLSRNTKDYQSCYDLAVPKPVISGLFKLIKKCNQYISLKYPKLLRKWTSNKVLYYDRRELLEMYFWVLQQVKNQNIPTSILFQLKQYEHVLKNQWVKFKVVPVNNIHFYDLTVEDEHSYWSNGSISHNTITTAVLAIMTMVRLGFSVAITAAIRSQSEKAVQYIEMFLLRIKPYLQANGLTVIEQNKHNVKMRKTDGSTITLTIVICTVTGVNSAHVTLLIIDEVDVVRFKEAFEEARLIPGMINGQYPLIVRTSTRKYAYGLMQQEIENAPLRNDRVLHWNILDVTERCPSERHLPHLPKTKRWISRQMPLRNLSESEWLLLPPQQAELYDSIEAYAGCAQCSLLPVCKMRLASRPEWHRGGMYKPIDFTIRAFNSVSPEMAESQLMCWKPSTTGLIYSRFSNDTENGNVYTLSKAWSVYTGEKPPPNLQLSDLIDRMIQGGSVFKAAVDWGYKHCFAITVHTILPNSEWWIVDTYAVPGLEFNEMMELAERVHKQYRILKWYPDDSQPMFITEFVRRKMPCVKFKKDVMGGIEAVRSQIVDTQSRRSLKVLQHERNEFLIKGLLNHHFKLDAQGNPTLEPDDEEYADVCDTVRYFAQNHFGAAKKVSHPSILMPNTSAHTSPHLKVYRDFMTQKIQELSNNMVDARGRSGDLIWDFSGSTDDEEA